MIAVIDLDGTLIDSTKRHYVLMEKLLKDSGMSDGFEARLYMDYKADGHSGKSYLIDVLQLSKEDAIRISSEWTAHIEDEELVKLDVLYDDAMPFLKELKSKDIDAVFLTARQDEELVRKEIAWLGIADMASSMYVVSPASSKEEKIRCCRQLLGKDELFVVGDTENEEALINEIDATGYLLNRGFRSKKYWDEKGIKSISSLQDIKEII